MCCMVNFMVNKNYVVRKPLNGGFSLSLIDFVQPTHTTLPNTVSSTGVKKKGRVYFFLVTPQGGSGKPPIDYRVHFFLNYPFFSFFHPICFFYHGACRDSKEKIATQRQSKFTSLRWAGDRQGRRCRETNTDATTGNPELNERRSLVVAPVRQRRGSRPAVRKNPAGTFV